MADGMLDGLRIAGKAACALALLMSQAAAQEPPPTMTRAWPAQCGKRAEVEQWLGATFRERASMAGIVIGSGSTPEMAKGLPFYAWSSPDGTWTITVTRGDEICILAAGKSGLLVEPDPVTVGA